MEVGKFKNGIWGNLREIQAKLNIAFSGVSEEYHLTMMQLQLLIEAKEPKTHTIGSLGKSLGIAGANVSSMCKRLEQEGYLKRLRDRKDERIVIITLTKKAEVIINEIEEILQTKYQEVLEEEHDNIPSILEGLKKLNILLSKMVIVDDLI